MGRGGSGERGGRKERMDGTVLILTLIPTTIAPNILRLLLLLLSAAVEHLVEEAELRVCA